MLRTRLLVFVVLTALPRLVWGQGDPLGPEFRVNTYTTDNQLGSSVASDSSGNFVVVWGSSLQEGSFSGIFGQRYDSSGSRLGPEFQVNTYTTSDQRDAAVASDASGNLVVVWTSNTEDGSALGVFGQRYAASGTPLGPEFRVNSYTTGSQSAPAAAFDPSGNFIVVWQAYGQDGPSDGVFGQRFAASGAPLGGEFRVNTFTTNAQATPSIATDGSGNFVVVWRSSGQDGSSSGVFGQRYAGSGVPLGPEFRVNTWTTNAQFGPAVAADAAGNFVVVWSSAGQDGNPGYGGGGPPAGVYGQRYFSAGSPLGGEFRVNTYTTENQFMPAVATDAAGNFVVVWSSNYQDKLTYGVYSQRYASSGVPAGPEFQVNTYTTSYQLSSAVASDSAGNFVVVWESGTQDGSLRGVFGQRYGQIVPIELMRFQVE
jgi:hypothetical protein